MSKRIVKFDEDDMKVIFESYMEHAGFKSEEQEIVGFAYGFKRIKKGGDFYKDVVEKDGPDVEQVKWVKVVMHEKGRKKDEPEDEPDTEPAESAASCPLPSEFSPSQSLPSLSTPATSPASEPEQPVKSVS